MPQAGGISTAARVGHDIGQLTMALVLEEVALPSTATADSLRTRLAEVTVAFPRGQSGEGSGGSGSD